MKRSADILARARGALARLVLLPIRAYSRLISPLFGARCRYYPTCSAYAEQAICTHGVLRGVVLAAWRLLRCNPFTRGGVDDVPPRGAWRSAFGRRHDAADAGQTHGRHA